MYSRLVFFLGLLLFSIYSYAQYKIRVEITSIPSYTPVDSHLFLAGTFNNWNPRVSPFQKNEKGYFFEFSQSEGKLEYKITRGSWDNVECNNQGGDIENRSLQVTKDTTIAITVQGWKDFFGTSVPKSTAGPHVQIIDTAFYIPQLNRYRRIWIYLPSSYSTTQKRYPVLYMHDGQNLFDAATSFSGEWGIDEALDTLGLKMTECIVVGIDNGGDKRVNEYCPYDFSLQQGVRSKGEGDLYVRFLVKTLKPFIDKKYRTRKNRMNTFIAGSSMGGLISLFAILRYPNVYGGAGIFSPAFQITPAIFNEIKSKAKRVNGKIYFYAGNEEGETMVPLTIRAFNEMHRVAKSEMAIVIRSDGKHNEQRWRMEFPLFYEWLMKN